MFIHIENFYQNAKQLFDIISNLDFKDNVHGLEIKDFNMIPQDLHKSFSEIVGFKVTLTSDSGKFRKPNSTIHFEDFNEKSAFLGIVALEDTKIKTYRHKETNSTNVFSLQGTNVQEFITNNCFDESKWDVIADINLSAGSLMLIRPWLWHGLHNKVVKVFYLEYDVENETSPEIESQ